MLAIPLEKNEQKSHKGLSLTLLQLDNPFIVSRWRCIICKKQLRRAPDLIGIICFGFSTLGKLTIYRLLIKCP